jgi:hypothetical protein
MALAYYTLWRFYTARRCHNFNLRNFYYLQLNNLWKKSDVENLVSDAL